MRSFQAAVRVLERVSEAESAADLTPSEQDGVEAVLEGAAEGNGALEAATQLLTLGTPLARVLQVRCLLSEL